MKKKCIMLLLFSLLILTACQNQEVNMQNASDTKEEVVTQAEAESETEVETEAEPETQETDMEENAETTENAEVNSSVIEASADERYAPLVEAMEKSCKLNETLDYLQPLQGTFVLASDEDVIYTACLDSYETDDMTPVSVNTTYEIGSVTKQIVAVAVLNLIQKGELSLEDTLDQYFPDYEVGKVITIDNLLRMQSGIVDYINEIETFFGDKYIEFLPRIKEDKLTDEEFLDCLYQKELVFEPGTDTAYSNTNYHLLAMILEQVSGKSYAECIDELIFKPCDMKSSSCQTVGDVTSRIEENSATPYFTMQKLARGCMDIHSNAADMLLFEKALYQGELLNEDMTSRIFEFDKGEYNCGWMKKEDGVYFHTGSTLSYGTSVCVYETEEWGNLYLLQFHPTKRNMSYCQFMMDAIMEKCEK